MKTLFQVQIGHSFTIKSDLGSAQFVKLDSKVYDGNNAICIDSQNATYEKCRHYFILEMTKVETFNVMKYIKSCQKQKPG